MIRPGRKPFAGIASTKIYNVLQDALDTIADVVLSKPQQATLVCGQLVLGNSATVGVLARLRLIEPGISAINPTPLGRGVQQTLARQIMSDEDHWIRDELFWPRMEAQIRSLAR